jgi:hypothetical protein
LFNEAACGGQAQKYNLEKNVMEINEKIDLKLKNDYLELSIKILELRSKGEEVPPELIKLTHGIGRLASIPDDELNDLLYNLKTQRSSTSGLFLLQTLPYCIE